MKTSLLILITAISYTISAQSFTSIVNQTIPDDGTSIEFEMEVAGLPDVIDTLFGLETVCLNIEHTWDSDLDIRLITPDGSSFLLISGIGWAQINFTNTCLNENSTNNLADGVGPYTGEWKPMGDMGVANNGQNPNGIWKLLIYDTWAFADIGYMLSWTINFGDEPALPFPFYSTNLPIIKINTGGHLILNEPKSNCEIEIIDHGPGILNHPTDTDFVYQGKILAELQGYTGPWYPKKNYDFDLIDEAGFEIDTVLLGLPAENDFILKAEYLDASLMKNTLSYEVSRRMGRYASRTKFCELMVDGEYLGVYVLTEKVKRDQNRVDIANLDSTDIAGEELTGGYIFEINENFSPNDWESEYLPINYATCGLPVAYKMVDPRIEFIQPEQLDYIIAYVDSFEDALYGDDFLDSLIGYRNYISVKSFIDFMLVNEFSANYDSYGRSTYLFKDKNGEINIGPPWDYDRAYAPWSVEGWVWELTHPAWPFPFWWSRFREDEEWRNEVFCRYTELREDVLSNDSLHAIIDSCAALINDAAIRNFQRWSELGVGDYNYFVDEMHNYVDDRLDWMDAALEADYVDPPDASFDFVLTGDTYYFSPVETGATYLWDFGDGTTSTEENPAHLYSIDGSYTVTLTVDQFYGCTAQSIQIIDFVLGVIEMNTAGLKIYPNPVIDHLIIQSSILLTDAELIILNTIGEEVYYQSGKQFSEIELQLQSLKPGNYLLQIKTAGQLYQHKIIKL